MAYSYKIKDPFIGYMETPTGQVYLTGKNFTEVDTHYSPSREQRIKPVDVSQFSLSNTSRLYRDETVVETDWHVYVDPYGNRYHTPAAFYVRPGLVARNVELDLETRLLLKIKDQKLSLGIALAQYRQTASLFSQTTGIIRDVLRGKRYVFKKYVLKPKAFGSKFVAFPKVKGVPVTVRLPKVDPSILANIFLMKSFGWDQMYEDVQGSVDVLQSRLTQPLYRETRQSGKVENIDYTTWSVGGRPCEMFLHEKLVHRVKSRYGVSPAHYNLSQAGLTNPAEVVWDWIPFSWVVDQFISIGSYLRALDVLRGTEDFRAYTTEYYVQQSQRSYDGVISTTDHESLFRGPMVTSLSPQLPSWKPSKSYFALTADIALLLNLRKSGKGKNVFIPKHV